MWHHTRARQGRSERPGAREPSAWSFHAGQSKSRCLAILSGRPDLLIRCHNTPEKGGFLAALERIVSLVGAGCVGGRCVLYPLHSCRHPCLTIERLLNWL